MTKCSFPLLVLLCSFSFKIFAAESENVVNLGKLLQDPRLQDTTSLDEVEKEIQDLLGQIADVEEILAIHSIDTLNLKEVPKSTMNLLRERIQTLLEENPSQHAKQTEKILERLREVEKKVKENESQTERHGTRIQDLSQTTTLLTQNQSMQSITQFILSVTVGGGLTFLVWKST